MPKWTLTEEQLKLSHEEISVQLAQKYQEELLVLTDLLLMVPPQELAVRLAWSFFAACEGDFAEAEAKIVEYVPNALASAKARFEALIAVGAAPEVPEK